MITEKDLKVERTADGSATLYRSDIDEHYHSIKGAIAESLHVYVDCGWRRAASAKTRLKVFEVGFGTGLNSALTAEAAAGSEVPTEYISVELYPLAAATASSLGYAAATPFFDAVNGAEWNRKVEIAPCFTLLKAVDNFLTMPLPGDIDVVYFDAFAPEKQPEMWSDEVFERLYAAMAPGGVLTTYCAKGIVRRRLQAAGFEVERLAGPANGKREILRAVKPA